MSSEPFQLRLEVNAARIYMDGHNAALHLRLSRDGIGPDPTCRVRLTGRLLAGEGHLWETTLPPRKHRERKVDLDLTGASTASTHAPGATSGSRAGDRVFDLEISALDAGGRSHRWFGQLSIMVLARAETVQQVTVNIEKVIEQHSDGAMAPINEIDIRELVKLEHSKSVNDYLSQERPTRFVPVELEYGGAGHRPGPVVVTAAPAMPAVASSQPEIRAVGMRGETTFRESSTVIAASASRPAPAPRTFPARWTSPLGVQFISCTGSAWGGPAAYVSQRGVLDELKHNAALAGAMRRLRPSDLREAGHGYSARDALELIVAIGTRELMPYRLASDDELVETFERYPGALPLIRSSRPPIPLGVGVEGWLELTSSTWTPRPPSGVPMTSERIASDVLGTQLVAREICQGGVGGRRPLKSTTREHADFRLAFDARHLPEQESA